MEIFYNEIHRNGSLNTEITHTNPSKLFNKVRLTASILTRLWLS